MACVSLAVLRMKAAFIVLLYGAFEHTSMRARKGVRGAVAHSGAPCFGCVA